MPRRLTKAERARALLRSSGDRKMLARTLAHVRVFTREESGRSCDFYYVDVGEAARAAGRRNILIGDFPVPEGG